MDNGGAFTDRLLADAGIEAGQSALDVGCGGGDVTFRLAALVGPSGSVVGVDPNEAALTAARERAEREGIRNVSFVQGGLPDLPGEGGEGYDLVACRRVLMYLPDKPGALRATLGALRPGGRLAIQEHDASLTASSAPLALNERANALIWATVRAEGADTALGLKLPGLLAEAGATGIDVRAEAIVQTPDQSAPTAKIIEVMADRIVARGTATREALADLDIPTLADRLTAERRAAGASFVGEMIFGVLATRPD